MDFHRYFTHSASLGSKLGISDGQIQIMI